MRRQINRPRQGRLDETQITNAVGPARSAVWRSWTASTTSSETHRQEGFRMSLRQPWQYVTVVVHGLLGERPLTCEFGIVMSKPIPATRSLGQVQDVALSHSNADHRLLREDNSGNRTAPCDLEREHNDRCYIALLIWRMLDRNRLISGLDHLSCPGWSLPYV